jgi:hypothetical protein
LQSGYTVAVSAFYRGAPVRVVHVLVRRVDFAKSLGEMREWLDRHKHPLVRFETAADGDTLTTKIQFEGDDLAEQFRPAFQGSY